MRARTLLTAMVLLAVVVLAGYWRGAAHQPHAAGTAATGQSPAAKAAATAGRQRDAAPERMPPAPAALAASGYAALAAAARRGDAAAARQLGDLSFRCAGAASDRSDLDAQLRELRRQFSDAADQLAPVAEHLRRQFAECAPLSPQQRLQWREWLALAAQLGDAQARLDYVDAGEPARGGDASYWQQLERYRAQADRFLTAEIARGNRAALIVASRAYDAPRNGNSGLYVPDPVKHHAYLYAYLLGMEGGGADLWLRQAAQSEAALAPGQLAQARALGIDILNQCCREPH